MKNVELMTVLRYLIVVVFLVVSGINTEDVMTWWLEVFWIFIGLGICLRLLFKGVAPTEILGWVLVVHAVILIYGAWYTYEKTPLGDWVSGVFGWERNMYDRFGHLAQGFLPAFLWREVLVRERVVNGRWWREGIVFAGLMAFTGIFEIIEFGAVLVYGDEAGAYLGSQGDVWDAQWDMVMCGIGGLVSIVCFGGWHLRVLGEVCDEG